MLLLAKLSAFYYRYDARELIKARKYKGIDFTNDEMEDEFVVSEDPGGELERTKSISYGCRIQSTSDDAFNMEDFLKWLAEETIEQIKSGKGTVLKHRHRVGKRFYLDYAQNGFAGRVEVEADVTGKDQMSLDVEIMESRPN